ncbi:MAG: hypothetical protein LBE13_06380, partial [Bacteroidales bacterium]|nr:hypothetical protein [Bacteroidales bacterium]
MRFFLLLLIFTLFLFFPEINSAQENLSESSTKFTEFVETKKSEVVENKVPPLSVKADKFRKEFSFKIRRGTAVRKDYDICKNGIEQLEFSEHKQPFYILLAL